MRKSPDAFRTISEVAQELDLPQHVLRFWETRFSQIKPMKRGGGRRYYRPDDVELLRGIRHLLYGEGYTIKGVQRILKEQGVRHVIEAFPGHVPSSEEEVAAQDIPSEAIAENAGQGESQPSSPSQPQIEPQADYSSPAPLVSEQSTNPSPAESIEPAAPVVEPIPPQPAPVAPPVMQAEPAPQQLSPVAQQPVSAAPVVSHAPPPPLDQVAPAQQTPEPVSAPAVSVPLAPPMAPAQPEMVQPNMPLQPPTGNGGQGANPAQQSAPVRSVPPAPVSAPQATATPADLVQPAPDIPQSLNNSTAPASIMTPHATQPTPMPQDLSQGEPVFRQGQEAAFSVEAGRNSLLQENKSGFFSRLRGKTATDEPNLSVEQAAPSGMPRDDVRRLQSTLFELLECKRILDQARNSS